MKHLLQAIVLLAYLPVTFILFANLPEAWQAKWGWYGPALGLLGFYGLVAWLAGDPLIVWDGRNRRKSRRQALKDSVNPPYPRPGR